MEEVPDCHISVAVRLRPTQGPVAWESSQKFLVDRSGERWHFDQVFGPRASTWDLYETSVQHVIDAFCDGATCTIFACGPRASGKTFTMQGGDGPGLVQLAATHIWERAPQQLLQVSYLEVTDSVRDLLSGAQLTRPWQEMTRKAVRSGPEEILRCLLEGNRCRRRDAPSSRSHTVFLIHMESRTRMERCELCCLSLVDLAAWDGEDIGDSTSRSFLALSATLRRERSPSRAEPLTQLLRRPLEASAQVVIICAISAGTESFEQSRRVLEFFSPREEQERTQTLTHVQEEVQALRAAHEGHAQLEGKVCDLEMETQELRLSLRMEQDAALTRQSELEERLRKTEAQLDALVQWKKSFAGSCEPVAPSEAFGAPDMKRRRLEEEKAESPYRQQGETALQVASELMRRLSAEERMDALIAESHQTSSGPGPTKRSPHALDPAGPKKVPERHTSPELLALPAPPTPKVRNGRRRPQFASASAAHTVAKAAQAEAEARQTRIRQLQQELVRQREALASKRRAPEDSGMAPESRPTEGEVALSELREKLKKSQEERQMGEAEIHGEQALLFPRPKRRAREVPEPEASPDIACEGEVLEETRKACRVAPVHRTNERDVRAPRPEAEDAEDEAEQQEEEVPSFVAKSRDRSGRAAVTAPEVWKAESRLKTTLPQAALSGGARVLHPTNLARPLRSSTAPRVLRRKDSENCKQM
ncbi:unnamed protein product [Durusdinium trenchii]|uniref:Kinesin motor domain-containing protein n=1 Tax=Durusdinium trenchii TaxID=1381693 RepID=A0ABP0P161_9DINO